MGEQQQPNPAGDELDADEEARFSRYYERRKAEDERAAKRGQPPKTFADAADIISDLVIEKLDARAEQRRKELAEDEPPSKGGTGGGSPFMKLLGG